MNVHVFVVNYASSDLLEKCLVSLSSEPVSSITIIDNFSGRDERSKIESLGEKYPRVKVMVLDHNVGFGPALNLAIAATDLSAEDLIWLLNPDTEVSGGSVLALSNFLERSDMDIVSPIVTTGPVDAPRIWFAGGVLDWDRIRTHHIGIGTDADTRGVEWNSPSTFITGAAMLMSYKTWLELGGFREDFFLYWEDADLCARAVAKGMRLGVCPNATIWHEVGGTGRAHGKSSVYYFYMQRNRAWLAKDWKGVSSILMGRGLIETLTLLVRPLREKHNPVRKFASSLRGLLHGLWFKPEGTFK